MRLNSRALLPRPDSPASRGQLSGVMYTVLVCSIIGCGGDATDPDEDLRPPAEPTGLQATALSSSRIRVSWTDNSTGEDGFKIYREAGNPPVSGRIVGQMGENVTTHDDVNLSPEVIYTYRVFAFNSAGTSDTTPGVAATTLRQAELVLSADSAIFTAREGLTGPQVDTISIANGGDDPLTGLRATVSNYWPVSPSGWLVADLDTGVTPTSLVLRAYSTELTSGIRYRADVEIAADGVFNSPLTITASVNVLPAVDSRVLLQYSPYAIAISTQGTVFVAAGGGRFFQIDPPYMYPGPITIIGIRPTTVASNPSGTTAYVTDALSDHVAVIDVATTTVIDTLRFPGVPLSVAVASNGDRMYVGTDRDTLYALDPNSHAVLSAIRVQGQMRRLIVHPTLDRVYASGLNGDVVTEVEADSVRRKWTVGRWPLGMAIPANGNELYVAHTDGPLGIIDLVSGDVTSVERLAFGGYAVGVTPDNSELYVTVQDSSYTLVIDRASLSVKQIIRSGWSVGVVFDPSGSNVLIANRSKQALDVIRP